jgi:hypothetical protein
MQKDELEPRTSNDVGTTLATLQSFIGQPPSEPQIQAYLSSLSTTPLDPETKSYSDASYVNYHALGISLCCIQKKGAPGENMVVESVDLYNPRPTVAVPGRRSRKREWERFKGLPLSIPAPPSTTDGQPLRLDSSATGAALVSTLGEPTRKGGGTGWVDVWLEYASLGLQIDLQDPRGDEVVSEEAQKKGMGGVWDRAGRWVWSSCKVFEPTGP